MKSLNLEALLDDRYPEASFHDADILRVELDYASHRATFRMHLVVSVDEREFQYAEGTLEFEGLLFFAAEAPRSKAKEWANELANDGLWLTDDGPMPDPRVQTTLVLPDDLPNDCFVHYFFNSTTSSFAVVAAKAAHFSWA